ncbi:hypothetical protein [Microbulbifer sp. VAAF005]|uniref:hypothetical protein n=1 Tax=Microbulbifer sp. VAAF005 TaxID=3034230 RepID=UPI0024AC857F|nr:hypothetical protein [Microbulbifer sp. VAAF005]WHI44614.1 hypothetical protein P0078_12715 [Microbulbifer sp. VAAF005]
MSFLNTARLAGKVGIWRVDGVGEVSLHPNSAPTIEIHYSGITPHAVNNPYHKSAPNGVHLTVKHFASELRDYLVGSVWDGSSGNCIRRPGDKPLRVEIDTRGARLLNLNAPVEINSQKIRSLIPKKYLRFSDRTWLNLRNSFYCLVPTVDDRKSGLKWLVIPASELYRRYIAVSRKFCNSGLTGTIDKFVDWNESITANGEANITLRRPLESLEKRVISRAVFSPYAKLSMLTPHKYLSMVTSKNRTINSNDKLAPVIKFNFPFLDTTHLTVTGKRMPLGKRGGSYKEEWALYVMEIHRCHYEMDFHSNFIKQYDPEYTPQHSTSTIQGDSFSPGIYNSPLLDKNIDINDLPADSNIQRLSGVYFSDPFPGLTGTFRYTRPTSQQSKNKNKSEVVDEEEITGHTNNDGNYSKDSKGNQGISTADQPIQTLNKDISLFIDTVIEFRKIVKDRKWKVVTRKAEDGTVEKGEKVAMFPSYIGSQRTWHKIDKDLENSRTRQVVWVEIDIGSNCYLYMAEMELRPTEKSGQCTLLMKLKKSKQMSEVVFKELLRLTCLQYRWPIPRHKWKEEKDATKAQYLFNILDIKRQKHPIAKKASNSKSTPKKVCPKEWAEVLLNKIDRELLTSIHIE